MWRGGFRIGPVLGLVASGCIFGSNNQDDRVGVVLLDPETFGVDDAAAEDDEGTDPADPAETGPDPLGGASAHNVVRANASPTPTPGLEPLVWDERLADIATDWAQGCRFVHSQAPGLGENLYVSSWESTLDEAVDSWADEDQYYDYGTNSCSNVCGHYTQIVWRDTERVGCGYADCGSIEGVSFTGRLWVCNYDPPGNFIGQRPY